MPDTAPQEEASLPANIVELGGRRITLKPPHSFSVCNEIAQAGSINLHRAAAAALGVCWQEKPLSRKQRRKQKQNKEKEFRRRAVDYRGHGCNPIDFGGAFQDAVMALGKEHGFGWPEIWAAGMKAWMLICDQIPTDADLEDAVGNSGRPPSAGGEE